MLQEQQPVMMDEAQLAEQKALRKQLQQEQDLLQQFQEQQENKLLTLPYCEKRQVDEGVKKSRRELECQVSVIKTEKPLFPCFFCTVREQIFVVFNFPVLGETASLLNFCGCKRMPVCFT